MRTEPWVQRSLDCLRDFGAGPTGSGGWADALGRSARVAVDLAGVVSRVYTPELPDNELVDQLDERERGLALVFVRTKRGADRLVKKLSSQGVEAVAMHGDKTQGQRERALARFASGKVDTLVATDVAARGIDVDRISHVINFDPPEDREAYVHRIGRTARAGRSGVGITFVDAEQAADVSKIAEALKLDRQFSRTGLAPAPTSSTGGRSGGGGSRSRSRNRARSSQRGSTRR